MLQKIVDKWKDCKSDTLGSVLAETITRWQKKVPKDEVRKGLERFVGWTREMQEKGMFGDFENTPPKSSDFNMFLKQATGSLEQITTKLQGAGIIQKGKTEKEEQKSLYYCYH